MPFDCTATSLDTATFLIQLSRTYIHAPNSRVIVSNEGFSHKIITTMSSVDDDHEEDVTGAQSTGTEPLACVTCRARKLKCDRTTPACARCTKVNTECVYPESRRKPTFKRRNVRELEERLGMSCQRQHVTASLNEADDLDSAS